MWKSLALAEAPGHMLYVEDRDGATHEVEPVEGWRLTEILRDYASGMENACGGALACAERHILLDPEWLDRVPPAREEELEKLDEPPLVLDNSRLSCPIIWSDELDGLRLKIAQAT
jgi:ferredoxin-2, mitochondrial